MTVGGLKLFFENTSPNDVEKLLGLFRAAFGIGDLKDHPCLTDERMMTWKYWALRPDWNGARSYALISDQGIQAHAGVLPLTYEGTAPVSALHFIDWAASRASLSGGAKLLRWLFALSDVTLAIGGSQTTRKLLPMLLFRPAGKVHLMVRPIRPWLQFRTHQYRDLRLPVRLARNAWWSRATPMRSPAGWSHEHVEPNGIPEAIWSASGEAGTVWRRRTAKIAAYYLSCPLVQFRLFLVRESDVPSGGFLLSIVNHVARIADLWVTNASEDRYERVYRLAIAASYEDGQVAELSAFSSIPSRTSALKRCGFRSRSEENLMVYARNEAPPLAFDCQMLDNDAAFLHGPSPMYLS